MNTHTKNIIFACCVETQNSRNLACTSFIMLITSNFSAITKRTLWCSIARSDVIPGFEFQVSTLKTLKTVECRITTLILILILIILTPP